MTCKNTVMALGLVALMWLGAGSSRAQTDSAQPAQTEARSATADAEAAARRAATAIYIALAATAKEDAHHAAGRIRSTVAAAHTAAKDAVEKSDHAYRQSIAANQVSASRAKESARQTAEATGASVQKAEAWLKAAAESDRAAVERMAGELHASLKKAEAAAKDTVTAGTAAAKATWKKQ